MCGIIGYVGKRNAEDIIIEGLERLSYRGYDSAGISVFSDGIHTRKRAGKISELKKELRDSPLPSSSSGIGHTRWATHGKVNDENSHPHGNADIMAVHNGIIENYLLLKRELLSFGYSFTSETDTEVAVLLIDYYYKKYGEPYRAIKEATSRMSGSYALVMIFKDYPDTLFATRCESPLLIGVGEDEFFVASDIPAFLNHTQKYLRLDSFELARITKYDYEIIDKNGNKVHKALQKSPYDQKSAEKNGFSHYMRKEIFEEAEVVKYLLSMYCNIKGEIDLKISGIPLRDVTHVTVVGCGTAYHAGLYLKELLQDILKLRTEAVIASEFRYTEPIFDKNELVVFISQSGETADTLSCVRAVKKEKVKTLAIVNVPDSSIAQEADSVIYTYAGAEIAVASTKAFTAQCTVLALFTLYMGAVRGIDVGKLRALREQLLCVPECIERIYREEVAIARAASLIEKCESLFFIGRRADHLSATEGSLKLKEITYIHSESYPAGELKHGTISLITDKTPVIALFGAKELKEKTLSNLKEAASRGAPIIAIAEEDAQIREVSDFMLDLPFENNYFFPIPLATVLQLLAYHTALLRGCDVDQPRNLAKSVTVE